MCKQFIILAEKTAMTKSLGGSPSNRKTKGKRNMRGEQNVILCASCELTRQPVIVS